jgi:hypothetical protein
MKHAFKTLKLTALNGMVKACVKLAAVLEKRRGMKCDSNIGKRFIKISERYHEDHND